MLLAHRDASAVDALLAALASASAGATRMPGLLDALDALHRLLANAIYYSAAPGANVATHFFVCVRWGA